MLKMDILAIVLIALFAMHVSSRYISKPDVDERNDDDIDLEEELDLYYEKLLKEFMSLTEELRDEREKAESDAQERGREMKQKMMAEVKKAEEKIKSQFDEVDYDYMSDGVPQPAKFPESVLDSSMSLMYQNNGTDDAKFQRERSKELRLNTIRDTILSMRGGNSEANSTMPSTKTLQQMFERNQNLMPVASSNTYTEKVQSFYPSCEVPKHADEELWLDSISMNLLFDVTYPNATPGAAINVLSATLRLYKMPQVNGTGVLPEKGLASHYGVSPAPTTLEDDRLLRVTVYWYTRTLKKNRMKRKLIASHMFNSVGGEWMEFNIRKAVSTWKEFGRNFGLVVTVEDEEGALLPAEKYIHTMKCSEQTVTLKPLPSIMIDATKQYMMEHPQSANDTKNDSPISSAEVNPFPYPNYLFPILDVCTIEVPVHEASMFHTRINSNPPTGYSMMVAPSRSNNSRQDGRRRSDAEERATFNTVGLGSPSAGQNRNNLVPILTKSDIETAPEDVRMKNELLKIQNERREQPRRRHSRKHVTASPDS